MPLPAQQGDRLVHDSAWHSCRTVLGSLGHLGEYKRVDREFGDGTQCKPQCDLKRCGRGETCADRQVRLDAAGQVDRRPA